MSQSLFNQYQNEILENSKTDSILDKRVFGRIVCSLFPRVKCKSFYSNKKKVWAYVGLCRKLKCNVIPALSEEHINTAAKNNGFTLMHSSDSVRKLVMYTDVIRDNLNVLKEVFIDGVNVKVHISGKDATGCLASFGEPKAETSKDLNCLLYFVSRVDVCEGLEYAPLTNSDKVNSLVKRPVSYVHDPEQKGERFWSVDCKGYAHLGNRQKLCNNCTSVGNEKPIHKYDHTYSINGSILHPATNENDTSESLPDVTSSVLISDISESEDSTDNDDSDDPTFTPTKRKPQDNSISSVIGHISSLFPTLVNDEFMSLIHSQLINTDKLSTQRRWDPRLVK